MFQNEQEPLCLFQLSNCLTLSLVLEEEEVAQKEEEEEETDREDDDEREAVQTEESVAVASGPSVGVGEIGGGSTTCCREGRDCSEAKTRMKRVGTKP